MSTRDDRRRRELTRALRGDAATLLADLESYRSDIARTVFACERILAPGLGRLDLETMQIVYEAAILSYARCFSSGVRMKLPFDINTHLSEDARVFHEQILLIRDKLIAHAVSPLETVIPVSVLADSEIGGPGVESVGALHFRAAWNLKRDVPNLLTLSRGVLEVIDSELHRLKAAILDELRKGDIQAMYAEPQITFTGRPSKNFIGRRRPPAGTHAPGKPWPLS